jgi:hypothetical protein
MHNAKLDPHLQNPVPQLRRLVAGFSGSIPGIMGFVVDKVALGWVSSEYFRFPLKILIPPTDQPIIKGLILTASLNNQLEK